MVLEMEMSKTYQYRKVMKPMLERKRRARINKCLDELKDIMVECLTQEGEHITRLEKADILELTVEHMKKLRAQKQLRIQNGSVNGLDAAKLSVAESFRAGYVHAANEVSKTLATVPGVSVDLGTQLMSHLGHRLNYLQVVVPTAVITTAANGSIPSVASSLSPGSITGAPTSIGSASSINAFSTTGSTSTTPILGGSTPNFGGYFDHHPHSHNQQHQQYQHQLQQHTVRQQNLQQQIQTTNGQLMQHGQETVIRIPVITPPPSECSSDRSCSPSPSESTNNSQPWRPW